MVDGRGGWVMTEASCIPLRVLDGARFHLIQHQSPKDRNHCALFPASAPTTRSRERVIAPEPLSLYSFNQSQCPQPPTRSCGGRSLPSTNASSKFGLPLSLSPSVPPFPLFAHRFKPTRP